MFKVIACQVEAGNQLGASPIDLTDMVINGTLKWDVPKGYWKVYVIYLTRDAMGRNDYINHLDFESCRLFIDAVYEPHFDRY